jgi:FkbM family methyltransferase
MNQSNNEMDIVCFHVGGYGDYSHINVIGALYPKHAVYVAFEARDSEDDVLVKKEYIEKGYRTILVQRCVSDSVGVEKFNINVRPESSSIFRMSHEAKDEHMPDQDTLPMWRSHATTDRVVEVETTTIDDAIRDYKLPDPDILSIDAQGAEFKIMQGGFQALKRSVSSVITEVEFHQIYENQPLFSHQFELLYGSGFRLVDILAMQYWHPLARVGHGLLTVGEALFIRFDKEYLNDLSAQRLIKFAAIAFAYKRLSIAVDVMNFAMGKYGSVILQIIAAHPEFAELLALRQYVMSSMPHYSKNAYFFENDPIICKRYGTVENLTNRSLP